MIWREGLIIGKYPSAVVDWVFDWSAWLGTDTIASYAVTAESGLTIDSDSNTSTTVQVIISGGSLSETYYLDCEITTAAGITDKRRVTFDCGHSTGVIVIGSCQ